jgi:hypothetical protein
VSRILVLPHDRTARRQLAQFAATFDRAFPARTIEIRRWLHAPSEPLAGVLLCQALRTRELVTGSERPGMPPSVDDEVVCDVRSQSEQLAATW